MSQIRGQAIVTTHLTLSEVNALDREGFVEALGSIFEGPPWIVEQAWQARPFRSIERLHQALCDVMYQAPREQQVALIQAHPDLVGRAALAGTLTPASLGEQASAGLDRLSPDEIATFTRLNSAYRQRFGFPFVICARENKKESILVGFATRLEHTREKEIATALNEIAKIARLRLQDSVTFDVIVSIPSSESNKDNTPAAPGREVYTPDAKRSNGNTITQWSQQRRRSVMSDNPGNSDSPGSHPYRYTISYGKARVPVYRIYATPLTGIPAIPESSFTGRDNILFAAEIDVEVFGENFLPAYTEGDNSNVVATDSMKNFILRHALEYEGATLEGYLDLLGHAFLATYPQMERLRLSGREIAFKQAQVPLDRAGHFGNSDKLYHRSNDDYSEASMDFAYEQSVTKTTAHSCGRVGMQLLKVTGSAFTHFVRDDYTTLPERGDRPLYIYLDAHWTYSDVADMQERYIPGEQVRDVIAVVFHEFVSESIQHLLHEMGKRLLARFPQMAEISLSGQNRTRDPVAISETDSKRKVYSDPFPAYGSIRLKMARQA